MYPLVCKYQSFQGRVSRKKNIKYTTNTSLEEEK